MVRTMTGEGRHNVQPGRDLMAAPKCLGALSDHSNGEEIGVLVAPLRHDGSSNRSLSAGGVGR
jgi:hypothetical protein